MDIPQNVINYLNSLDIDVEVIDLSHKGLTVLPNLSKFTNLTKLFCYNNQIEKLDKLPDTLKKLYCDHNKIQKLNNLPNKLQGLDCSNNLIQELNNLPKGLIQLYCDHNQIQELNNLPDRLIELHCDTNKIKQFDNIPKLLKTLYCHINPLPSFNIKILKEIDIDRRKEKFVLFIVGIQENRFDNDDIFRKISEYVLT